MVGLDEFESPTLNMTQAPGSQASLFTDGVPLQIRINNRELGMLTPWESWAIRMEGKEARVAKARRSL
jgi:hypothetical protein